MCGHVQRKYASLSTQNVRVITKNCFDMEDVLICMPAKVGRWELVCMM